MVLTTGPVSTERRKRSVHTLNDDDDVVLSNSVRIDNGTTVKSLALAADVPRLVPDRQTEQQ